MGVDISDLVNPQPVDLKNFKGNMMGIDAFNTIYQFLSNIREFDGSPLRDKNGNITSHLSGLFYRNINIIELGIIPVYVFDGKPHPLKEKTIKERIALKEKAEKEYLESLALGDIEKARSYASRTSRLTQDMVNESMELLLAMGIPVITAPSEGEAEASYLCKKGKVAYVVSQDYDSLLFGAPKLLRNITISGKRRVGRSGRTIDINPEMIILENVLKENGITHEQLVDIGILIGTDFNDGIKGIGPKKAIQLIKKYGSIPKIPGINIENYDELRNIFLNPVVKDIASIDLPPFNEEKIIEILVNRHDFSFERVQSAISRIKNAKKAGVQRSIDSFF